MFWGIVSSVLSVFNTFAYQRSILVGASAWIDSFPRVFYFNAVAVVIVVAISVATIVFSDFARIDFSPYFSDWTILLLSIFASLAGIGGTFGAQYAYANERAGTLAPYSETGRLFTVLFGFFLFSNSSWITFWSAMVAILAIVGFSIDFRSFSINRYCAILAASGLARAFSSIAIGYVVLKATPFSITLFDVLFASTACFLVLVWRRKFPKTELPKLSKFVSLVAANDVVWVATFVISLLLLKDIGIVATSLLGMLTLVLTIVLDCVRTKTLPDRKIAALAFVVAACVLSGSLFR